MASDRHAFGGLGVVDRVLPGFAPVVVAAFRQRRLALRALQDEAGRRLVLGELDRLVEQRLVGNDAGALDAAAGREDDLRLGVVDAGGELLGGETAEHHRMDGADARAGEHGDHRLRHHRHIEDDAVALGDAEVAQHGAEQLHLRQQAAVGEGLLGVGDGRIVDQRGLVVAAGEHVAVERVVAGVADAAGEPAAVDAGVLCRTLFSAARSSRSPWRPRPRSLPGRAASARRRRDSGSSGRPCVLSLPVDLLSVWPRLWNGPRMRKQGWRRADRQA